VSPQQGATATGSDTFTTLLLTGAAPEDQFTNKTHTGAAAAGAEILPLLRTFF